MSYRLNERYLGLSATASATSIENVIVETTESPLKIWEANSSLSQRDMGEMRSGPDVRRAVITVPEPAVANDITQEHISRVRKPFARRPSSGFA